MALEVRVLNRLSISGFKAFAELATAEFAPITLIYGPNSAGKSSVIQSLLLLKQSNETFTAGSSGLLARGPYVDLGGFRSLVSSHDLDRDVTFGAVFSSPPQLGQTRVSNQVDIERELNKVVNLTYSHKEGPRADEAWLSSVIYGRVSKQQEMVALVRETEGRRDSRGRYIGREFEWLDGTLEKYCTAMSSELIEDSVARRVWPTLRQHSLSSLTSVMMNRLNDSWIEQDSLLPTVIKTRHRSVRDQIFEDAPLPYLKGLEPFARDFNSLLQRIVYLGPLRSHPARHYIGTGLTHPSVGSSGELTPEILIQNRSWLLEWCNQWFRLWKIPYRLDINTISDDIVGGLIVLSLTKEGSDIAVGPSDVGFGIGQLLPIVVQSGLSSRGGASLICVEQPEIHLHPRLQAELADLFMESAHLDPLGTGTTITNEPTQWIVETHSESLVLRVQRRIRESSIDPNDIAVLYVRPESNGSSSITRLHIDESGEFIEDWPDGFFEEAYNETFSGDEE
jgi:hypothetical protein